MIHQLYFSVDLLVQEIIHLTICNVLIGFYYKQKISIKVKYPLMAAIMVTVAYDYGYYMYADVPQGH
jgi:hypothetical protein